MKTEFYKTRLLAFANYLEQITKHPEHGLPRIIHIVVIEEPLKVRIPIVVKTQHWFFEELVSCFPEEWEWSRKSFDPVLEGKGPNAETGECVFEFFGINDYEIFCHFFDIEGHQQVERWGGVILDEDSMGAAVARNIKDYLSSEK